CDGLCQKLSVARHTRNHAVHACDVGVACSRRRGRQRQSVAILQHGPLPSRKGTPRRSAIPVARHICSAPAVDATLPIWWFARKNGALEALSRPHSPMAEGRHPTTLNKSGHWRSRKNYHLEIAT